MPIRFAEESPGRIIEQDDPHLAVVLLVDISNSMAGRPIDELNEGVLKLGQVLQKDPRTWLHVDICIISYSSSVRAEMSLRPVADYEAPSLCASGQISMNEAIEAGLNILEQHKYEYRSSDTPYYRPWLFLLTGSVPSDTDREVSAKSRLQESITERKVFYLPVAIGDQC